MFLSNGQGQVGVDLPLPTVFQHEMRKVGWVELKKAVAGPSPAGSLLVVRVGVVDGDLHRANGGWRKRVRRVEGGSAPRQPGLQLSAWEARGNVAGAFPDDGAPGVLHDDIHFAPGTCHVKPVDEYVLNLEFSGGFPADSYPVRVTLNIAERALLNLTEANAEAGR